MENFFDLVVKPLRDIINLFILLHMYLFINTIPLICEIPIISTYSFFYNSLHQDVSLVAQPQIARVTHKIVLFYFQLSLTSYGQTSYICESIYI